MSRAIRNLFKRTAQPHTKDDDKDTKDGEPQPKKIIEETICETSESYVYTPQDLTEASNTFEDRDLSDSDSDIESVSVDVVTIIQTVNPPGPSNISQSKS